MAGAVFDLARSEDKDVTSEEKMQRLHKAYLDKAVSRGANAAAARAIDKYFADMSAKIRDVEHARLTAEPTHLEALVKFAQRAYRRPLTAAERDDLLGFYRRLRER